MTIFDIIDDILYTKDKGCLSSVDDEKMFSPYIVNRWLSMYGKATIDDCDIINRYMGIFNEKKDCYNFFNVIFSKMPRKKINYIKKKKTEESDNKTDELIARNAELSVREIKNYIDLLKK